MNVIKTLLDMIRKNLQQEYYNFYIKNIYIVISALSVTILNNLLLLRLTSLLSLSPAKDHTLLNRAPITHGPVDIRPTADAPAPHLPEPRSSSVAVGNNNIGPTPQVNFPDDLGDKNAVNADLITTLTTTT